MFVNFFFELKKAGIPTSLREYLTLLEAMEAKVIEFSIDDFYYLSRSAMVKDERHIDKFDRVFGHVFKGLEPVEGEEEVELPEEWLRKMAELYLTEEERQKIEAIGGWQKLMETLQERLKEQEGRHQGGSKWIGTAGTSPFGAYGYNPEGVRIGQSESRNRRAVKVWDKREFKNFDDSIEIGIRNIQVALRRLRKFAREGAPTELDLPDTIKSTANNGGYLDLKLVPERHNQVKVLLFFDVGGSMDDHIRVCEEMFSACRTEFKHLEYFYFHNFIYDFVWKDNRRRNSEVTATWDVLHKYARDYRVIFVGDASMAPYEIASPGGNIEYFNEEAGATWMQRVAGTYDRLAWLNPTPESYWEYTQSIHMIKELVDDRMFPLTLSGLDTAMRSLAS